MNYKHLNISLWFKELNINPGDKVKEIEESLNGYYNPPFIYETKSDNINIQLPRVIGINKEENKSFNMSLINASMDFNFNIKDIDELMLIINENIQVLYDTLVNNFELEIIYSSIKVDILKKEENKEETIKSLIKEKNLLEDLLLKRGYSKGKYYINITDNINNEVKYDIKVPNGVMPNEQDMLARSMLISLEEAKIGSTIHGIVFEMNNRCEYNKNKEFRINKDEIREFIFDIKQELKKIV